MSALVGSGRDDDFLLGEFAEFGFDVMEVDELAEDLDERVVAAEGGERVLAEIEGDAITCFEPWVVMFVVVAIG